MDIDNLSISLKTNGADDAITKIATLASAVTRMARCIDAIDGSKLESFANGLKQITSAAPSKANAENMRDFASAIKAFADAISGTSITQFANDMGNVVDKASQMGSQVRKNLNKAANAVGSFKASQTPGGVQPNRGTDSSTGKAEAESLAKAFATVNSELEKVNVSANGVKGVLAKMGVLVPTNKFKNLQEQAEKVRIKYNELRATMQKALESGKYSSDSDKYQKKVRDLEALRNEYDRLIEKQKELALSDGFKINPNITQAFQGISQAVGGVKQSFSGVASVVNTVNGYVDSFLGKIKSLSSASKRAKRDTVSLTDSFKKFAKEITRVSKMLKLMITRMALRAVIKQIGNGFKSLALHSQEFDNTMSNLINTSKTLGYSVSGMAGELINALAPVLLKIIELITRAINALNQLFAALRGKSTWNKAKQFTGSWADSIKDANKNAKELKKTVLSFDELNQLQDNKSGGGGGGNDITDMFEDVPIDPWFKDLAEKIEGWAEKLFAPIKSAWEKVGQWVVDKWKYALDEVLKLGKSVARDFWRVWEQPETEQIFKNLLIIVGEIGRTIGNLAKRFREAWDYNQTGYKILVAIRDIILIITNHLREMATATADWAATLNFKPLLTSIQEWLESLKPAVDAVMGILSDFYRQVVLKFTSWVIESGLPALIDVFKRFNEEVDWDGLREKLRTLWEHLEPFMETVGEGLIIFVERITQALADFINGEEFADFLTKLEEWMDSVTPEDVADGIEKLVKALIAFRIAGLALSALSGVGIIIGGIVTAFKGLASIAGGISSAASAIGGLGGALAPILAIGATLAMVIYSITTSFGGLGETVNRIKDGIKQVVDNLKGFAEAEGLTDAWDELKESFSDLAETLGGMESAWQTFGVIIGGVATIIGSILIPQIKRLVEMVADWTQIWSGVVEAVSGAFDILVGIFTGDGDKIRQGAEKIWEGVQKAFSGGIKFIFDMLGSFVDLVLTPFKLIKYYLVGDPIVVDMWNDIKDIFDKSIGKVIEFVTGLKDDILKIFSDIKSSVDEKITAIKEKFGEWSDKVKETKENIGTAISNIRDDIHTKLEDVKAKVATFKEDWSQKWDDAKAKLEEAKTNIQTHLEDMKTDFISFKDKVAEAFSKENWTFSGVVDGLKETFADAKKAIGDVWNGIADKVNGEHEIGSKKIKINLPKIYARGGFPEDGLFFANHTELVGEFSNGKTAVANNAQIVAGIESGVYKAVSAAMANNSGSSSYIANEIIVDGDVIARTITKAQEKQNRRYSPQTV